MGSTSVKNLKAAPVLTSHQVLRQLEEIIIREGGLRRAADVLNISPQHLSNVLLGKRGIGPLIMRRMGLRRKIIKVIEYQEITRKS